MEQEPNQAGGETIWLIPEESLSDVPPSHRALITDDILQAFASPQVYFRELARKVALPAFQHYLEVLTKGRCALLLATAEEMFGGPQAAFQWWVPSRGGGPRQLLIEPGALKVKVHTDPGFEALFSHVSWVHWSEIGYGGGLFRPGEQPTLQQFGAPCKSKLFPKAEARVFGSNSCGDMLVYNAKGEAGFLSHENGKAYSLGSVSDSLNWVFDELRHGREPAFDYQR